MEEKVLIKGVFSKRNTLSIIFYCIGAFFGFGSIKLLVGGSSTGFAVNLLIAIVGCAIAALLQYWMNNCEITVTDKRVYGKAAFGKRVDLPADMISSVDMCAFKGVGVSTSSGRIQFLFCTNQSDVFNAISNGLLKRQTSGIKTETIIKQEIPQSNADELKKYKDLLDSDVITQEEFDAKKKQLLGL